MQKSDNLRSRWVETEAAKYTTPDSMRQRIAFEQKQIQTLTGAGLEGEHTAKALEAHHELIRVLTERLAMSELVRQVTDCAR
ncbi:hypothetical protein [Microvirga sp. P5_D2]